MDSLVFVPSVASTEWLSDLFPDYSLAELPVAGRRIVDYGLEIAQKSGAMLAEVLDWHYTKRLEEYFNDPTRTGSAVFYCRGEGNLPRGLDDLAGQPSSPLTQSLADGLVVVWGPCLALKLEECEAEEVSADDRAETPLGVYRRVRGGWEAGMYFGADIGGISVMMVRVREFENAAILYGASAGLRALWEALLGFPELQAVGFDQLVLVARHCGLWLDGVDEGRYRTVAEAGLGHLVRASGGFVGEGTL